MPLPRFIPPTDQPAAARPAHIAIEMPSNAGVLSARPAGAWVQSLRARADAMWLHPSTRAEIADTLDELRGVFSEIQALTSPSALPRLIRLHQLGVINLNDFGRQRSHQNAIEFLVDASPPLEAMAELSGAVDLTACLKRLTEAGVSIHGHVKSHLVPLAAALHRGSETSTWVKAMLDNGANPLQRCQDPIGNAHHGAHAPKSVSCLELAVRRGHNEAITLMVDALLDHDKPLTQARFIQLFKAAIESDCCALLSRLMQEHEQTLPGLAARCLFQFGRQIGPQLFRHLVATLSFNDALLSRSQNLPRELLAVLPDKWHTHSEAIQERNRWLQAGLDRSIETDDPGRLRTLLTALRCSGRQGTLDKNTLADLSRTCGPYLDELQRLTSFDPLALADELTRFERLWASQDTGAHLSDSSDPAAGNELSRRAGEARLSLSRQLASILGEEGESYLSNWPANPDDLANQNRDDALLRTGRALLEARDPISDLARALTGLRSASASLRDDGHETTRTHQTPVTPGENALHNAFRASRNRIFNSLIDAAIEKTRMTAAMTLLGAAPDANMRAGLYPQSPAGLLRAIGPLSTGMREQLLPRICQYVMQDPDGPDLADALRDQIDSFLPTLATMNSVIGRLSSRMFNHPQSRALQSSLAANAVVGGACLGSSIAWGNNLASAIDKPAAQPVLICWSGTLLGSSLAILAGAQWVSRQLAVQRSEYREQLERYLGEAQP